MAKLSKDDEDFMSLFRRVMLLESQAKNVHNKLTDLRCELQARADQIILEFGEPYNPPPKRKRKTK